MRQTNSSIYISKCHHSIMKERKKERERHRERERQENNNNTYCISSIKRMCMFVV